MRRRQRKAPDPETAAALEVCDRLADIYETLDEAGDRWAAKRRAGVLWTRGEIDRWGLDAISELNVKGYERSIRHYTGPPLPLRPAVHWTNGPPEGYDEPWRDPAEIVRIAYACAYGEHGRYCVGGRACAGRQAVGYPGA